MARVAPSVVVLAGPNGAGESTLAAELVVGVSDISEFLDADVFARRLSRSPTERDAIAAGRAMLQRLTELASERKSFGFETTLASRTFAPKIRTLIQDGYEFHLVFLWLPSPPREFASVATMFPKTLFAVATTRVCGTSSNCTDRWRRHGACTIIRLSGPD